MKTRVQSTCGRESILDRAAIAAGAMARPWRLMPASLRAGILAGTVLITTRAFGQSPPAANPDASATTAPVETQPAAPKALPFLRVVDERGKSIELQIASRDYVRADGTGPRVGLVAVAHLGDRAFFRNLQKLLAGYDAVLYESVKPEGASRPGGETAAERIESTRASMRFVRGVVEAYRHKNNGLPANIEALRAFAAAEDARLGEFIKMASIDAWGRGLQYGLIADAIDPMRGYSLLSLGADGAVGGEGESSDITLGDEPAPDPMALSKEDGLQAQLADALGLEFQLDAMDYGAASWRCSDMAVDEIDRRLRAKGLDFDMLGGTLAGSSLSAKVIKLVLGLMKMADSFMEGAITDTFKVVMIEMLGDPALVDASMNQLGQGFGEVIINDRNQVPLADLKAIIADEPDVKSVAIFYGAGHMSDLHNRLVEMGYAPAEDSEQWLGAIKVDLTQSAVSPAEINRIRSMMKQMIRQQLRAR